MRRCSGAHGLAAVGALIAGCASAPDAHAPHVAQHLGIAAYGIHEQCVQLEAGDRLDYRFTASEPVRFAIQYGVGNAVVAPIQREAAREEAGIYPVAETREYCLAWEAGAAGAFLDYRFVARPPAPR